MTGTRRLLQNPLRGDGPSFPADPAVLEFHRGLPGYAPTPLRRAPHAASALGVREVFVKDESDRLGMPSFKILGASWAVYRLLCERLGRPVRPVLGLAGLAAAVAPLRPLELVAATDGNQGRAVARMARHLGLTAHILVPPDMVAARVDALRSERARVTVVDGGYDDAVRASAALADDAHLVVSDTSWPGYTDVPGWVVEGYATILREVDVQLDGVVPTLAAVQIGVGAFAAGMLSHLRPGVRVVGVEPAAADCVLASVEAGGPTTIPGPQTSIMAGLNCGTPSLVAWPIVSTRADAFAAVDDDDAEAAMRLLAEDGIVSGESGAAGLAGLLAFRDELLRPDDVVLVVSTEGATDPRAYDRVLAAGPSSAPRAAR